MPGGIPICQYDSKLGMFRVLHSKGKSVVSGGYGVSISEKEEHFMRQQHSSEYDQKGTQLPEKEEEMKNGSTHADNKDNPNGITPAAASSEFLFMEEALFLHERGLIEVYMEGNHGKLDSSQLFELLKEKSDVSLPVYLAYKYLRVQTFVVVRHTPKRLELVNRLAQAEKSSSTQSSSTTNMQEEETSQRSWKKRRKTSAIHKATRDLRDDTRNAPTPVMVEGSFNDTNGAAIAFDVYKPNSEFRKTNPGPPDFCVAITSFSQPSPPVTQLHKLIESCQGIGLRIATVADSGAVIMFGVTDYGVPILEKNNKIDKR
mmetsp:Transcript_10883/g.16801  ORF Transcript_10883/g.16801 Transcript_10883/m.16801 type:complete len:316 (-) Transcript_10883:340-1287(-)|eukprot:CAMPEP_0195293156 /NCGR_PEP_ID=MMETSP0707-20130614/11878_1 /TAXON_ID=33640 /ORGANISM="Asterionellopsis glacialis, Strain CCMP134" /LENGTH=315 /DNA_ID=CAMNT_0040353811 /DNA_START=187 /DNA_END=1134 /DNA_ORIENTATION=+